MDYMITDIKNHFNIDMFNDAEYLSFNAFIIIICVLVFVVSEDSIFFRIKRTFLILYMDVVYSMTVQMRIGSNAIRKIRMQPLYTVFYYQKNGSVFMFWQDIINILMFLPIGLLCTDLIRGKSTIWKYLMMLICITLFSVIIETEQYYMRAGVCEFDDILTNTIGGVIGMVIGSAKDIQIIKKGKGLSNNGTD